MSDIKTIILGLWNKTNTGGSIPPIIYKPPKSGNNYKRCIELHLNEDNLDEIGINRTHQDSVSMDIYNTKVIGRTETEAQLDLKELRRICRQKITDNDYSYLDWQGGKWSGPEQRRVCSLMLQCYRSGIPF